jgi:serine/threonine protein kinase
MNLTKEDQLVKILERFPNNDANFDISFLKDRDERAYHFEAQILAKQSGMKSLPEIFPNSNAELVDILTQMLEYNPKFRPSARELLKNKIFDKIRVVSNET